jgi:hypothetical protein
LKHSLLLVGQNRLAWVVLAALVTVALACAGGDTGGGTGAVEVVNNSSVEICYLYISPTTSNEWGQDWLGTENTVPPGSSFTVRSVPPGNYDLRADDCTGSEIDTANGVQVSAGQTVTWTFADN